MNKYCSECKKEGIVRIAQVESDYGSLCEEHHSKLQADELLILARESSNRIKSKVVANNSNNIFQFCKAN